MGEPDRLGPQMALESVHVVDGAGGGAALGALGERHGRGPAARALLLAAGQERAPGVRVAPLTRDDQLGPRELKKYRLLTEQVRRTRERARPGLSPGGLQACSPTHSQAQPCFL